MTSQISHHDHFFKKFFGDISVAKDFLSIHLPENLRQQCNLNTLALCSGSFIEDDLRAQCSDILYSMKTSSGNKGYIYALIEHQSRPEKLMAFRLLRYAVAAMQRHLEQGNDTLPVVIPLLLYQGKTSPYPYSTHCLDCFSDPELAKSVYMQAFPLVDVTVMEDEEILTHRRVALIELIQKHIRTRDMLELVTEIAHLLEQWKCSKEHCKTMMYYIALSGNTQNGEKFIQTLAQKAPSYQEELMTIAEQLEAKGLQQGIQQGIQQGYQEATRQLAQQLLANGVKYSVVKISTGLTDEELNALSQKNHQND